MNEQPISLTERASEVNAGRRRRILSREAIARTDLTEAPTLDEAWEWVNRQREIGLMPVNVE